MCQIREFVENDDRVLLDQMTKYGFPVTLEAFNGRKYSPSRGNESFELVFGSRFRGLVVDGVFPTAQ